jgi:hypothetical protein
MAAKDKGQIPLEILEDRYTRLGRVIKRRGGKVSDEGPFAKEASKRAEKSNKERARLEKKAKSKK